MRLSFYVDEITRKIWQNCECHLNLEKLAVSFSSKEGTRSLKEKLNCKQVFVSSRKCGLDLWNWISQFMRSHERNSLLGH